VSWAIFWFATPVRDANTKDFFFTTPFYNMIRARPTFYGTIFRLLPIPNHLKSFILGISPINFEGWYKSAVLSAAI
jgi:hypothetical protein